MLRSLLSRMFQGLFILAMAGSCCLANGFATVDYALLLAFHPQMARYDFSIQRFYLPEINLGDKSQMDRIRQKMEERAKEMVKPVEGLYRDRGRVQRDLAKLEESSKGTIAEMLSQNKDVSGMQKTYAAKSEALQKELADVEARLLAAQEGHLDFLYLPRDKSIAKLRQIFTEIDATLAAVSQERGNLALVDRSFAVPELPNQQPPVPAVGMDLPSADLYSQLLKFDFAIPHHSEAPPDHPARLAQGLNDRFTDLFQKYLTQNASLRPVVSNLRGRLFLAGGLDVTGLALGKILDANGVRPEIKARLLQLMGQVCR